MSIRSRLRRHYLNVFVIDDSRSFYNWHPDLSEANPAIPSRVDAAACVAQLPDTEPEPPRPRPRISMIPTLMAEYVQISIANRAWDDFKPDPADADGAQFIASEAYWATMEHCENLGYDMSDLSDEFHQAFREGIDFAISTILLDDENRTKVISHADSGSDTGLAVIVLRHDGDYYTLSYDSDGAELLTHGTTTIHAHLHPAHDAISRAIAEAF